VCIGVYVCIVCAREFIYVCSIRNVKQFDAKSPNGTVQTLPADSAEPSVNGTPVCVCVCVCVCMCVCVCVSVCVYVCVRSCV
jgi:hypothetical protein